MMGKTYVECSIVMAVRDVANYVCMQTPLKQLKIVPCFSCNKNLLTMQHNYENNYVGIHTYHYKAHNSPLV